MQRNNKWPTDTKTTYIAAKNSFLNNGMPEVVQDTITEIKNIAEEASAKNTATRRFKTIKAVLKMGEVKADTLSSG